MENGADGHRVLLVTGPSGAGRTTVMKALEDIGHEPIDNLPLSLIPRLFDGPTLDRPTALGVDTRNREFSATGLVELIDRFTSLPSLRFEVLYVDCAPDVLVQRFSETRRRHPLAQADSPEEGIARERDLLGEVHARADFVLDTTEMTPHETRAEIARMFGSEGRPRLAVSVQSFSYKRGVPRGLDMVFDCRFLRNPHWQPDLRPLDGRDARVAEHVTGDPKYAAFHEQLRRLTLFLLPAFVEEGKTHLSIGFGCTGGQHRSVAVAEKLARELAQDGWQVSKRHREMERRETRKAGAGLGERA